MNKNASQFGQIARRAGLKLIVLTLCFSLMNIPCGISQSDDFPSSGRMEYMDEYVNGDYAFSVKIPPGIVGARDDYQAPNHGFIIKFSSPDDYILVDGSHDVADFEGPSIPTGVIILEEQKDITEISGVAAARYKMKVKNPDTGEIFIHKQISTRKGTGYKIYTVRMKVPEARYEERLEIFNSILSTFKIDGSPTNKGINECF